MLPHIKIVIEAIIFTYITPEEYAKPVSHLYSQKFMVTSAHVWKQIRVVGNILGYKKINKIPGSEFVKDSLSMNTIFV